ncbi:receptor-like protein 53 [Glycine soja]|uniref:receptor-like protein 53 n=1 Tax=Glycine soja TaxID=3848 RepID=UPI00103D54FC|nr:receptor-like protein 53 [Glycine soja]
MKKEITSWQLANAKLAGVGGRLKNNGMCSGFVPYLHCRCTLPHYNEPSLLNFSSLQILDLSRTSYSPAISFVPKWILKLNKLVSLQLWGNEIQGPIPGGIRNLTLLQNLDLSFNSFSSSIPDCLYGLHRLKFLNLMDNNLHGTICDALGNLTSLVELDLSYNLLEGTIPTSLANLCNLREIGLSYLKLNQQVNELLEILAPCISHGLTTLAVQSSQLSVEIHLKVLDHSKLSSLRIDGNNFQGVVKEDDLANLTSLKEFHALGNNFTLKVGSNWLPSFQLTCYKQKCKPGFEDQRILQDQSLLCLSPTTRQVPSKAN